MGGFSLAFRRQGFRPIWANENDKFAVATYRHNNPDATVYDCDAALLNSKELGLEPPDVLTAGFPCQPFSQAGDRLGFEDARGVLYTQILRILREFGNDRPPIVLLENVAHLLWHEGGRTFARIEGDLKNAGYWVLPHNIARLNTRVHTEIPQNRERVFIVALSTSRFKGGRVYFPGPSAHRQRLQDLLELAKPADEYYYFDTISNKYGQMLMRHALQGTPGSVYQLRRSYVREHKEFLPTLTANMGDGGHNVPVVRDQWGLRQLTTEECATFQGFVGAGAEFPDQVSRVQRYKQIGNSVTVPLVEILARSCAELLTDPALKRRSQ
jgi:DNA (cytosine-5)-methyltransferase 1